VIRPARLSFELHPPIAVDKGTVLRELGAGFATVLYAGDDIGDRPAFDAIEELRGQGVTARSIAVGADAPVVLVGMADAHLPDPAALVALLNGLR
jgi:trehalose 6-phosphate phosphatase